MRRPVVRERPKRRRWLRDLANPGHAGGAFRDILTGALMGGINGYILISSVWYYLAEANYPFKAITAPDMATEMGQNAAKILASAFPTYMHVPVIYYAMVIVFFLIIGAFV